MIESYEEYLKRTNQKDSRSAWKWWKIEVCGKAAVLRPTGWIRKVKGTVEVLEEVKK